MYKCVSKLGMVSEAPSQLFARISDHSFHGYTVSISADCKILNSHRSRSSDCEFSHGRRVANVDSNEGEKAVWLFFFESSIA